MVFDFGLKPVNGHEVGLLRHGDLDPLDGHWVRPRVGLSNFLTPPHFSAFYGLRLVFSQLFLSFALLAKSFLYLSITVIQYKV